ncbi:MAG: 3-deoxy-7-phosphoheptulonate synthase, partial [Gammaproteobacteria bacterium]|nr:3-deoxy-7-phosphoheptulonate synthase [Gammaproteobacteria bacterium]
MYLQNDDVRINNIKELLPPVALIERFRATTNAVETVYKSRQAVHDIVNGKDNRLVVIIGPCSIHDPKAAIDYAKKLAKVREKYSDNLEIVMRVYFEKPRTTIGWKGLINDPFLNSTYDMDEGLKKARSLLLEINKLGLPTATEILDPITPQYIAGLLTWVAIGARTTESQTHREMASGLSMPVGFKNSTDGSL